MDTCDVLIVGGGPAGSTCARRLRQAGLDVIVMDRSVFPRDKVCAGWITPQVVNDLELDCHDYHEGRTFQPITGFRTGVIGSSADLETLYDRPVSFGIRRCEFDHYLLQRSDARLSLGTPVSSISRRNSQWIINDSIKTPVLVGAGGHFCPVARWLNPVMERAPMVVAQEAEFSLTADEATAWPVAPGVPELYFCRDLSGYGWVFRKEQYVNIGFGRLDHHSLPQATTQFMAFLRTRGTVPREASWRWRGHAYLVSNQLHRRATDAGVMLIGDAAGVAYPQSGEGIRPAIESGLLAAATIIGAKGRYGRDQLESYERHLHDRFGGQRRPQLLSRTIIQSVGARLLPWLLRTRWFTRRLVLEKWFLHLNDPPLVLP
jgi:geranylgeranyl reductase family protein